LKIEEVKMAGEKFYELGNFPKDRLRRHQASGHAVEKEGARKRKNKIRNRMLRAMEGGTTWQNK
jgi:hypothetical protein